LIDDETGVEFTIIHTFVDPPKRDLSLSRPLALKC
jgi:hypothetical protein